jgi:hypothetical protein
VYINASQIRKKKIETEIEIEIEIEIETAVVFTHGLVRCSKATNVFSKIIITKAKLQAISNAIAICSEKALKNSEI